MNSARWGVIWATVIVAFLTILSRAEISGAKVEMAKDLRIGEVAFGAVFGAFALGYAVFMVPSGLMADRWGPRKALSLSVFSWSLFTFLTGLASGIWILVGIRFLFGIAEAGVFPQAARAIHNWTFPRERGLALGLLNMGSRLGAAFGLVATPLFVKLLGWRQSFVWLGVLGIVWAAVWFWWFRDQPQSSLDELGGKEHSAQDGKLNQESHHAVLWPALLQSRNFYLIIYQYFASQFTFFICLSWLLPFLNNHYAVNLGSAGLYSSIPLCCGALAMWSGGVIIDRVYKLGHCKLSRTLPAMIGFSLAIALLLPAPFMTSPGYFVACFAGATFGLDLTIAPSWTVCCDIGSRYSGTLSAVMNTMGALGSLASSLVFPLVIRWTGNIRLYFFIAAWLNLIALVCWKYIEPSKTLFAEKGTISEVASIEQDTLTSTA